MSFGGFLGLSHSQGAKDASAQTHSYGRRSLNRHLSGRWHDEPRLINWVLRLDRHQLFYRSYLVICEQDIRDIDYVFPAGSQAEVARAQAENPVTKNILLPLFE